MNAIRRWRLIREDGVLVNPKVLARLRAACKDLDEASRAKPTAGAVGGA